MPSSCTSSSLPRVLIFQTSPRSENFVNEKNLCSLSMTWDTCTASWNMNRSLFPTNLTSITNNRQGVYTLLYALSDYLVSYLLDGKTSQEIDDEEKRKWLDQISILNESIVLDLFDESIDPKEYWVLDGNVEEVTTDVSQAFRNHRNSYWNTQIYKFLTSESELATEFRRHPSYLHLPLVYKFNQEGDSQPCDVYLTFSDTPSSDPKKSMVCVENLLHELVELEIAENASQEEE